jgi:PAS domain S-box-containing protein
MCNNIISIMVGSTVVKYNEIIITTDEDYLHHPKILSAILEINPDAVVLSKLSDSEIVDCNKEFLKQTGYSREEVIGNKILDLNLLSREEYTNYVDEIREKKTLSHFEVMVRRKDGSFIYALNSAKIIIFNDMQMVLNIAHDITGYKTVEANKQMLANLVESSEDAVITKSISGIIKSWNNGAEQIYGYLPEDVIGKHISILAPKHLKDEISELIEKVKQGKKVRHHETIRLKKDGKLINVSVTLSPILDTSGNTVGISTIARDISELKRREEKLESTMNDLKRSNKELQQFAYVSSHDLQEPIRMVTLYSQLLEKRYKDRLDDDANDFIEFIVDGAYRMKHLIDDLLVYSRVTSQIKEFEYINLETVLSTVISNLSVTIQENNAKIIHDPLPTASADPTQIGQVFQNLITNAIKFQGKNTPEIHISVQKQRYYKEWIFAVKDNGIGIERRHQERIFEVFKRLHTREEYPGTGIGLSIVKKIIKHHGGQIWVESEPGKGSTFYFTIPKKNFKSNSV